MVGYYIYFRVHPIDTVPETNNEDAISQTGSNFHLVETSDSDEQDWILVGSDPHKTAE